MIHLMGLPLLFLPYYEKLLTKDPFTRRSVNVQLVQEGPVLTEGHRNILNASYTADQVQKALFSIPGCEAPGVDGLALFSMQTHGS